jgi:hypothetical protein
MRTFSPMSDPFGLASIIPSVIVFGVPGRDNSSHRECTDCCIHNNRCCQGPRPVIIAWEGWTSKPIWVEMTIRKPFWNFLTELRQSPSFRSGLDHDFIRESIWFAVYEWTLPSEKSHRPPPRTFPTNDHWAVNPKSFNVYRMGYAIKQSRNECISFVQYSEDDDWIYRWIWFAECHLWTWSWLSWKLFDDGITWKNSGIPCSLFLLSGPKSVQFFSITQGKPPATCYTPRCASSDWSFRLMCARVITAEWFNVKQPYWIVSSNR